MALTLWQRMLQIMAQNLATSKNEQTKGVKEPLQQSQTAPKDTKQKEQQDNAVKQDKPEKI